MSATYYCVMRIEGGRVVYLGTDEDDCAEALDDGTCFGKAEGAIEAERVCNLELARIRRRNRDLAAGRFAQ